MDLLYVFSVIFNQVIKYDVNDKCDIAKHACDNGLICDMSALL